MSGATAAFRAARDQLLELRSDHERAVREFRWPDVGPVFSWAVDWFDEVARGEERAALVLVEEDGSRTTVSYEEMRQRSDRTAVWLGERGVTKGDAVVVMLGNQVELWESMLGLMKLGAVAVPTTTAIGAAGLRDRIARGGVRHVICNPEDTVKLDDVPGTYTRVCAGQAVSRHGGWHDLHDAAAVTPEATEALRHPGTAPGDPLLHYFTSGTTARPKLVEHSQVSYPVGHLTTMYWLGLRPGDVHLNISSPGWGKHAWSSLFAPWNAGATVYCLNYRRFDAASLLERLREDAVTTFCAPPTVWRMLIKADLGERPAALRELASAGEPLNPEVITQVQRAWGATIRDAFGQTETTASIGNPPGAVVKPGSMGRPLPGVPVVVVDPATGEPAAEGEICLDLSADPLSLMTGYRGADGGATDGEATGGRSGGGRYYRSGDLASVDADGYITYIGREDDVFKASDYKISPFEVESVLIEHPAVAEAAVVPAPDALRQAVVKAYVALAPGHEPTRETALAVLAHARENLPAYQRVRRVEFVDLPKTLSGKIRRVDLREREVQADAQADARGHGVEWRDDQFPELSSTR